MISTFFTTAKYIISFLEKLSKSCPSKNWFILSIADKMCSKRPLSLTGSLIKKQFIVVCTLQRKRKKRSFLYEINAPLKQIF